MGELRFVRGYDHRDDRRAWLDCLEAFLRTLFRNQLKNIVIICVPECSTTTRLYTFHYICENAGLDTYSVARVRMPDLEQIEGCHIAIKYIPTRCVSTIRVAHHSGQVPFVGKAAGQGVLNLLLSSTWGRCGTTVQDYLQPLTMI
jgi:hypothetical protein